MASGLVLLLGGCSDARTGTATLVSGGSSPTRVQVEERTGLRFPSSMSAYRSVRLSATELDIAARIASSDVDRFVADSQLQASGGRVITHASPVWDQNPAGDVRAYRRTANGTSTALEIVAGEPSAAAAALRIVVTSPS